LLPNTASARLTVEIFAYGNDYSRLELRLNLTPHVVIADSFPAPAGKKTLDLAGLRMFLQEQGTIEGGRLDPRDGLTLLASKPNPSPQEKSPVSIADLAVAYRAVFHAGDNEAFVSLDPHRDPTKVTVNFGGLLEDTYVGGVVLEADKRFKTLTCGLDPRSMHDVRSSVRARIPSFLTSAERELVAMRESTGDGKWQGTRFWYYPESIVVDSDLDYSMAAIRKAQFTADAERSRSDFQTPEQFEQFKARSLSPAIRQNIDHLNAHYLDYAAAFPELRELMSVARLFGVCVWLKRAEVADVDLDALLSVVLPSFRTERERVQLVASSVIGLVEKESLDAAGVAARCRLTSHTEALGRRVADVFGGWKGIAEYLCMSRGLAPEQYRRQEQEAQRLFAETRTHPAASLVKSRKDLETLAEFLADQVEPEVPEAVLLGATIEAQRSELNDLEERMESLKAVLDRDIDHTDARAVDEYNAHVRAHNLLVGRHESVRVKLNADVDRYNALGLPARRLVEIGGGIALDPDSFTVNRTAKSTALERLGTAVQSARSEWTQLDDGSQWIRSRSATSESAVLPMRVGVRWVRESQGATGVSYRSAMGGYWFSPAAAESQWRDQITTSDETVCRLGSAAGNTMHVATFRGGGVQSHIIGTRQGADRIVFVKSGRTDDLSPDAPPAWYRP